MGRGKLKLELIANEKSRKTTFQRRKKGMMKKAYEFSVLCDIDICLLISGPKPDQGQAHTRSDEEHDYGVIETFPPEKDDVLRIIQKYKKTIMQRPPIKSYNLPVLLTECNKKVQAEIFHSRKKYYAFKYPTSAELVDGYSADELAELVSCLDRKIEVVQKIIEEKKENQLKIVKNDNVFQNHHDHSNQQLASLNSNFSINSIMDRNKPPLQFLLNQKVQLDSSFSVINPNSMMMKLLDDEQSTSTTATGSFGDHHDQFKYYFNRSGTTTTFNTMQYYGTETSAMRGPIYEYPTSGVMHENNMMMFNGNDTGITDTASTSNNNMQYDTGTTTLWGPVYNYLTAGVSFDQYVMMFNGTDTGRASSSNSVQSTTHEYYYPPLVQPVVPFMQYPMNMMNVGQRLNSFQVTPNSKGNELTDMVNDFLKNKSIL